MSKPGRPFGGAELWIGGSGSSRRSNPKSPDRWTSSCACSHIWDHSFRGTLGEANRPQLGERPQNSGKCASQRSTTCAKPKPSCWTPSGYPQQRLESWLECQRSGIWSIWRFWQNWRRGHIRRRRRVQRGFSMAQQGRACVRRAKHPHTP